VRGRAPARSARWRRRLRIAACLGAVALAAWWAFAPLEAPDLTVPELNEADAAPGAVRLASLDLEAFRAPLWVAPPAPPEPEPAPAPPPPPPPLRMQLLAVVGGPGAYSAVLYDPDADRLVVVAAGESLAEGRVVEGVTASGVSIRDDQGVRTLALREERGGAP
jgi:hypothetical protein